MLPASDGGTTGVSRRLEKILVGKEKHKGVEKETAASEKEENC